MSQEVKSMQSGSSIQYVIGNSSVLNIKAVQPASSITVGASPFTYTNSSDGPVVVSVSGGTVTSISLVRGAVNSGSVGTSGVFLLHVGDQLVVAYTAAPTMTLFPLFV